MLVKSILIDNLISKKADFSPSVNKYLSFVYSIVILIFFFIDY